MTHHKINQEHQKCKIQRKIASLFMIIV